jgi:putative ABC transport system substrate-binding protein
VARDSADRLARRRAVLATLALAGGCGRKEAIESGRTEARRPDAGTAASSTPGNRLPRVVILVFGPHEASTAIADQPPLLLLRDRLKELGHVDGKTLVIEEHFAEGDPDRMEAIAREVVATRPDVIVAVAATATLAVRRATSTIPIVMAHAGDPVGSGLAESLSHPGGNVTGTTSMVTDLGAKQLEILSQLVPRLGRLGVLFNSTNPGHLSQLEHLRAAARPLMIAVKDAGVARGDELETALGRLNDARPDALFVMIEPMLFQHRARVLDFLRKKKLPSSFDVGRQVVREGGLVSYGPVLSTHYARVAEYVDKILKGARAGDLPIHQPTEFALVINLKTATALGLTVPRALLLRADEVVQP